MSTQLCRLAIASAASTRARSSMAWARSLSALAMSVSVTPWARGTSPAIRLAVFWRRPAAAWLKRSMRLFRTEATSDASARERTATMSGTAASTSTPHASAARSAAKSAPRASLARTSARSASESPARKETLEALGLGQRGEGQVLGRKPLHGLGLVVLAANHLVGRQLSALVGEHAHEHLAWRHPFGPVEVGGLRVGVVAGVNVEPVGFRAPGHRDVEDLSGGARRNHGVRGVDGATLGPVRRRGVGELDVPADIVSGEVHLSGPDEAPEGQGPVVVGAGDAPLVAVAYPSVPRRDQAVVLAGHHQIADSGGSPA